MANYTAYDVYSAGRIIEGFESTDVIASFSGMFRCAEEKAAVFTNTKKIIRKDIDQITARTYATTLKSIGLDVSVVPRTPVPVEPVAANNDLSLAPADPIAGSGTTFGTAAIENTEGQSKTEYEREQGERAAERQAEIDAFNHEEPFFKAILGPIIAACLGAILWAVIINLGYEFGLIAIAVGGMIGWAASQTEFIGYPRGVVCAALCALAIFGGKFIGYSWMFNDTLANSESYVNEEGVAESWDDMYAREAAELRAMDQSNGNLKQFMLDNGYAYSYTPVTQDDIDYFREVQIPEIEQMAGLTQEELQDAMGRDADLDLSVWTLVFMGLSKTDFLFLFFGMGAAFRLATEDS